MDNKFRAWFAVNYPGESTVTRAIAWEAYLEGHARAVEAIKSTKTSHGMEKPVRGVSGASGINGTDGAIKATTPIIPKKVPGNAIVWADIQLQKLPERPQERQ